MLQRFKIRFTEAKFLRRTCEKRLLLANNLLKIYNVNAIRTKHISVSDITVCSTKAIHAI